MALRVAELLRDLVDKSIDEALKLGIEQALAKQLANRIARRIAREWGGQNVYIPSGLLWGIDERDREIWEKFNGSNHIELSKKYGLSVVWIYKIIERVRAELLVESQQDLFGGVAANDDCF